MRPVVDLLWSTMSEGWIKHKPCVYFNRWLTKGNIEEGGLVLCQAQLIPVAKPNNCPKRNYTDQSCDNRAVLDQPKNKSTFDKKCPLCFEHIVFLSLCLLLFCLFVFLTVVFCMFVFSLALSFCLDITQMSEGSQKSKFSSGGQWL